MERPHPIEVISQVTLPVSSAWADDNRASLINALRSILQLSSTETLEITAVIALHNSHSSSCIINFLIGVEYQSRSLAISGFISQFVDVHRSDTSRKHTAKEKITQRLINALSTSLRYNGRTQVSKIDSKEVFFTMPKIMLTKGNNKSLYHITQSELEAEYRTTLANKSPSELAEGYRISLSNIVQRFGPGAISSLSNTAQRSGTWDINILPEFPPRGYFVASRTLLLGSLPCMITATELGDLLRFGYWLDVETVIMNIDPTNRRVVGAFVKFRTPEIAENAFRGFFHQVRRSTATDSSSSSSSSSSLSNHGKGLQATDYKSSSMQFDFQGSFADHKKRAKTRLMRLQNNDSTVEQDANDVEDDLTPPPGLEHMKRIPGVVEKKVEKDFPKSMRIVIPNPRLAVSNQLRNNAEPYQSNQRHYNLQNEYNYKYHEQIGYPWYVTASWVHNDIIDMNAFRGGGKIKSKPSRSAQTLRSQTGAAKPRLEQLEEEVQNNQGLGKKRAKQKSSYYLQEDGKRVDYINPLRVLEVDNINPLAGADLDGRSLFPQFENEIDAYESNLWFGPPQFYEYDQSIHAEDIHLHRVSDIGIGAIANAARHERAMMHLHNSYPSSSHVVTSRKGPWWCNAFSVFYKSGSHRRTSWFILAQDYLQNLCAADGFTFS